MGNGLAAYIERLELMAYFAGYPFIYALVYFIAEQRRKRPVSLVNTLVILLPFAYALTATLYLGFLLKNMFPYYTVNNIAEQFKISYLQIWGLLGILFWIPIFSKKTIFSLLHSLVFFFMLLKDLVMYITFATGKEIIKNDMKIYTGSLLLNSGSLAFLLIIHFTICRIRKRK